MKILHKQSKYHNFVLSITSISDKANKTKYISTKSLDGKLLPADDFTLTFEDLEEIITEAHNYYDPFTFDWEVEDCYGTNFLNFFLYLLELKEEMEEELKEEEVEE